MKIVFHGKNASTFRETMEELLSDEHELVVLPDVLESAEDIETYRSGDVIVGISFNKTTPVPHNLKLYQVPGAGYDGIDLEALPSTAALCNCFGHENAIAEYVFAALLARHVPLAEADSGLRKGDWTWWAGGPARLRSELGIAVPGEVSVIGFDDVPIAAWPAYDLTSYRQPVNQMVAETVTTLIERIGTPETEPRRLRLEGRLILRGSSRNAGAPT